MISGILSDILGYFLTIGLILCFLGGSILGIVLGIREYLEKADWIYLLLTILGCVGVTIIVIVILKALGL